MTEPLPTTLGVRAPADAHSEVWNVPDNQRITLGAPSLLVLPNGKWLVAFDQAGPGVKDLPGKRGQDARRKRWIQGRVMASADNGATWQLSATFPFRHASLFRDGGDVYLFGEASGRPHLMRSPDGGGSWSRSIELPVEHDCWLAPTKVLLHDQSWLVPCQTPVGDRMGFTVFRAPQGASLMNRKAWAQGPISAPLAELIPQAAAAGVGVPVGPTVPTWRHPVLLDLANTNHPWHAPGQVLVIGATTSGRQHWAAMLALDAARLVLAPQQMPTGEPWVWLPLPGGHDKFDLFRDSTGRGFCLLGSQGSDGLPLGADAVRQASQQRVGLWRSDNLAEWHLAKTVLSGESGPAGTRRDPSAAIVGNDLVVAYRAGGSQSRSARDTTRVCSLLLKDFRSPVG